MASDEPFSQDMHAGAEHVVPEPTIRRPGRAVPDVGRLFENFKILLQRSTNTLVLPWFVTVVVDFVFVGAALVLLVVMGQTLAPGTAVSALVQLVSVAQFLVVYTLRVALLRLVRDVMMSGPLATMSVGEVFQALGPRLLPVLVINVVVGALVSIGLLFCVVPGLVALFFLAFAPYLVAARGRGVIDALRDSVAMARHQWVLLVTAIAVSLVFVFVLGVVSIGASAILVPFGWAGAPVAMILTWAVHAVLGFFAWLYWGAVFVTADQAETQTLSAE